MNQTLSNALCSEPVISQKISAWQHIFGTSSAFFLSPVPIDSSKHQGQEIYTFLHVPHSSQRHFQRPEQARNASSASELADILSGGMWDV